MKNQLSPPTIKGYTYKGKMSRIVVSHRYHFFLYVDNNGREYVCKYCLPVQKKLSNQLKNEALVYSQLQLTDIDTNSVFTNKTPQVFSPRLISQCFNENESYILLEKVPGKLLPTFDISFQIIAYQQVLNLFNKLSKLSSKKSSQLARRKLPMIFILLHYMFLVNLIRMPNMLATLLKAVVLFNVGIPYLLKMNTLQFVHRDLGGYNNILVNDNIIYVLDFELACNTNAMVEVANLLVTRWRDTSFRKQFLQSEMLMTIYKQRNLRVSLRSMIIYAAMFDLYSAQGNTIFTSASILNFTKTI